MGRVQAWFVSAVVVAAACSAERKVDDDNAESRPEVPNPTTDTDVPPPPPTGPVYTWDDAPYTSPSLALDPDMLTLVHAGFDLVVDADAVWLSWEVDGQERSSPTQDLGVGHAEIPILGVPQQTDLDVTLHAIVDGEEDTWLFGRVTTGALPAELDEPDLLATSAGRRPEPFLLTSVDVGPNAFFGPCYAVILDDTGRIVWYRKTTDSRLTWQPRVSRFGGYLLIDASTYYSQGVPSLTRATLDLAQVEEIEIDDLGIAYDELEDGSFVFDEAESGFDYHLSRQYPDGHQERIWSCRPWMQGWTDNYWDCASNTVSWYPDRGTVLYSMFQTSTVVEIDLATGAMVNEFGQYPGGLDVQPASSMFELQHFPNFTDDGTLILSTHSPFDAGQYAREFEIDDANQRLVEVWTASAPAYAEYAGQVQRLPNGNVLWQLGTAGIIVEMAADGEIVWEVAFGKLVGNATPIADLYALTTGFSGSARAASRP